MPIAQRTASAVPTRVQTGNVGNTSTGASLSKAFGSNTTAGNLIVVGMTYDISTSPVPTCSDSAGNTYSSVVVNANPGDSQSAAACWAQNIVGGADTVTVNWTNSPCCRGIQISEFSGVAAVNAADVTAGANGSALAGTDVVNSGSATTTSDGQLIFAVHDDTNGGCTTATAGTGFSGMTNLSSVSLHTEYKVQSTAGPVNATVSCSGAGDYAITMLTFRAAGALPTSQGDGLAVWGRAGTNSPLSRTYNNTNNQFSLPNYVPSAQGAVTSSTIIRTSPTKKEAVAGFLTSAGQLYVSCFDGTNWTAAFNVTVGGGGTTRPFDIAYETNSGDVMVAYGTNTSGTNELGYRTKLGSTDCTAGNWSSANTLDSVRTTGVIKWIKAAWDRRATSNTIAIAFEDANRILSTMVWSGTAWTNEPSSVLDSDVDYKTTAADIDDFDIEFTSVVGEIMVVWANNVGAAGTNGVRYAVCQGGTSSCTWSGMNAAFTPAGLTNDAMNLDISANPVNDEIVFASQGDDGHMQAANWSGTSWAVANDLDTSTMTAYPGAHIVSTGWLVSGGRSRSVIAFADASSTQLTWYVGDGTYFQWQAPFAASPAYGTQRWFDIQMDPLSKDRLMFMSGEDTGPIIYAKRLTMDGSGNFTWSNADGGNAIESAAANNIAGDFNFAFWRNAPTYTQSAYRWYANADSATPGSALAAQNASYNAVSLATPYRLRTQLTNTSTPQSASGQAFTLQYGTSTSGPWTNVGGAWWNSSWTRREKITFDNRASNSNLTNFPVRVALSSANITYAQTKANGADIRFVDPDGTSLAYEIENWDTSGTSNVWVKVPQVDGGSNTDFIYVYYGNPAATDAQTPSSVWDASTGMVQHFEETAACSVTFTDSTSNANNGACNGTSLVTTPGKIGSARSYTAADADFVSVADSASTSPTAQATFSGWFNQVGLIPNRSLMAKWNYSGDGGWALQTDNAVGDRLRFFVANSATDPGNNYFDTPSGSWTTGWHFVTVTFDGGYAIYIDGVQQPLTTVGTIAGSLRDAGASIRIGDFQNLTRYWNGAIDEVRVESTARSMDWTLARYLSESNSFNTFGSEETYSSGGWRYYDNATPAHGATLGSNLLTGSTVSETYQEREPSPLNPNAIATSGAAEYDWALNPAAVANGTYYFRMVKPDGTAVGSYSQYAQLLAGSNTAPNAPTGLAQQTSSGTNIPANQIYSYDSTTAGSMDAQGGTISVSSGIKRSGSGAMKDVSSNAAGMWINDGVSTPRNLSANGSTFSAWVYVPSSNSGTGWTASMNIYDNSYNPHYGSNIIIPRDTWTYISYTPDPALLSNMTFIAIGIFGSTGATDTAYVDDVYQGNGLWSNDANVKFTASASDPDSSDTLKLCVEVQPINTAFTNTETSCSSSGVGYSGTPVAVNNTIALTDGTQYHWQARLKDAGGLYSSWVAFGGNTDSTTSDTDFGVDTSAPTPGTVYDGTTTNTDAGFNDGSLTSLSANWSGFGFSGSPLAYYEYSIGTTAGGTSVKGWTSTYTTASVTATGLSLRTGQIYFVNVRATDGAGNQTIVSSNGQIVAPTLTFNASATTISFDTLNAADSFTSSKSMTATVTTNAYNGYKLTQRADSTLTSGSNTIPMYAGTWTTPTAWTGAGLGYTSSDTSVSGSNRFNTANNYAGLNTGADDIVADSSASAPTGDAYTLTYKVVSSGTQPAGRYLNHVTLTAVASF